MNEINKHEISKHEINKHEINKHEMNTYEMNKHTMSEHTMNEHEMSADEKKILCKAEAYCATVERCVSEVRSRLEKWGADHHLSDVILAKLQEDKFIDEQRFASAFVRDKYRFNQWGRVKIAQSLRLKCLSDADIQIGLDAIDEEEYRQILASLIAQKRKSVKGASAYERNGKLIRFALGRGFEMNLILQYVKEPEDESCFE